MSLQGVPGSLLSSEGCLVGFGRAASHAYSGGSCWCGLFVGGLFCGGCEAEEKIDNTMALGHGAQPCASLYYLVQPPTLNTRK